MKESDIIVIGGGPAGYVAAIRAAQLGARVVLIEEKKLGGTCINHGCIPTKFLIHNLSLCNSYINTVSRNGVMLDFCPDYQSLQDRKKDIITAGVTGIRGLLKSNNVELINARAVLRSPRVVEIVFSSGDTDKISSPRIIIATGSQPAPLPVPGANAADVLNYESLLDLTRSPGGLGIIGGGVVGVEMANIFKQMGCRVAIFEMMPRLLPGLDADLVSVLVESLEHAEVQIFTGVVVEQILDSEVGKTIVFSNKQGTSRLDVGHVAVCVGQKPNINGLGLNECGIEIDKGSIRVDSKMQTSIPGIFAAGDVVGGAMLAHVAFAQGRIAAENALGKESQFSSRIIPQCIYTSPEIASIGLDETTALSQGYQVKIGRFPFFANSMAAIHEDTRGFVKIVTDLKYGQVLGVQVIGAGASHLIGEAAVAVKLEATIDEIIDVIHPHPSFTEAFWEAALDVKHESIHFPSQGKQ